MDRIRNEHIRGTAQEGQFVDKVRGKTKMVWACAEEGCRARWEKSVEYGATGQEEKRKTKEEVHGCGDGGNAGGWCDRGRRRGQSKMETDDPLW